MNSSFEIAWQRPHLIVSDVLRNLTHNLPSVNPNQHVDTHDILSLSLSLPSQFRTRVLKSCWKPVSVKHFFQKLPPTLAPPPPCPKIALELYPCFTETQVTFSNGGPGGGGGMGMVKVAYLLRSLDKARQIIINS